MTEADLIKSISLHERSYNVVTPGLALAVARRESALKPLAIGAAGEYGLFQIMPATFRDWKIAAGRSEIMEFQLLDPMLNMQVGLWYLYDEIPRILRQNHFAVNVDNVLMSYNGGPGNVIKGTTSSAARLYSAQVSAAAGYSPDAQIFPGFRGLFAIMIAGAVIIGAARQVA